MLGSAQPKLAEMKNKVSVACALAQVLPLVQVLDYVVGEEDDEMTFAPNVHASKTFV